MEPSTAPRRERTHAMMIELYAGPSDGRTEEVTVLPSSVRVLAASPVTASMIPDDKALPPTLPVTHYHRTHVTRNGRVLYVWEGLSVEPLGLFD